MLLDELYTPWQTTAKSFGDGVFRHGMVVYDGCGDSAGRALRSLGETKMEKENGILYS